MRRNKTLFFLYAAGVMILLLYSLHVYFLWWMYDTLMYQFVADFVVGALGLAYMVGSKIPIHFRGKALIPFLLVWIVTAWNPLGITTIIYNCPFTLLTLLILDKETLRSLLKIWTTMYAIILAVSLVAWPFAFAGLLPSQGIISFGDIDAYHYQNYLICLVNINIWNWDVVRFCSIFLEPGHVAMIGAFTLYANRYDFQKWTSWAILIPSLFTLSLAGYLLLAIGFLMLKVQKTSLAKSIGAIFGAIIVLGIGSYVAINYNNGDNLVNTLIFERLEYDEDKGIVGNNRTIGDTDNYFESFISSSDFLIGLDRQKFNSYIDDETIGGAGYKMYLLEKGLLGTLLILICYILISKYGIDKRFVRLFLLFYIIAFFQRAWPATHIWLYLFIFATAVEGMKKTPSLKYN